MLEKKRMMIACIADDFTGAGDAASFLTQAGLKTLLCNGISHKDIDFSEGYDAVVIALKTRTVPAKEAVSESLEACRWLLEKGATQLYIKYCSTFDSSKHGNIGPVVDAVLEEFHLQHTILCPALPVNGRTVKDGNLYVNNIPLHESPMKNHPLTPMWASDIAELMKPQGKYDSIKIGVDLLSKSTEELDQVIKNFAANRKHFYIIPDYYEEVHGNYIARAFGEDRVLSGGSGLLFYLAQRLFDKTPDHQNYVSSVDGKGILLAGSCSEMTLKQIAAFEQAGGSSYQLVPEKLWNGEETIEHIWQCIGGLEKDTLLYCSQEAENVKKNQGLGKNDLAPMLENALAEIAQRAVKSHYRRIIVAGGETSGAVIKALQYHAFEIGESVASGVPVLRPVENRQIRVILKSGNFGDEQFFQKALEITGGKI